MAEQNLSEVVARIEQLLVESHDYESSAEAAVEATVAVFNYMANALDLTGFQASWARLKVLSVLSGMEDFVVRDHREMLYPQFARVYDKTISSDTWSWLQEKAKGLLSERIGSAHPDVVAHWQSIVEGQVPFGYSVKGE